MFVGGIKIASSVVKSKNNNTFCVNYKLDAYSFLSSSPITQISPPKIPRLNEKRTPLLYFSRDNSRVSSASLSAFDSYSRSEVESNYWFVFLSLRSRTSSPRLRQLVMWVTLGILRFDVFKFFPCEYKL